MILTRRGTLLLVTVVVAISSGIGFGARGLNGIAAPGIVALAAGIIQVVRLSPPSVDRTVAARGQRGETLRVTLRFRSDRPVTATVSEVASDGLDASDATRTVTLSESETAFAYDLGLDARGKWTVGPTRVVARDVLGLVATTFEVGSPTTVLVAPRIHDLVGPRGHDLSQLFGGAGNDRQEFDQLRSYERGDPMRDIHWKSSAKRPPEEFIIKQYGADEQSQVIEIVAEAPDGQVDAMADAAASVADHLLENEVTVGLTTPDGRVPPDGGPEQRRRILQHLALVTDTAAPVPGPGGEDVHIRTTEEGTVVEFRNERVRFADLVGGTIDSPGHEGGRPETERSGPRMPAGEAA